jgi:hypothetical protein
MVAAANLVEVAALFVSDLKKLATRALPRNHCNGLRLPIIVGINSDTVG